MSQQIHNLSVFSRYVVFATPFFPPTTIFGIRKQRRKSQFTPPLFINRIFPPYGR